MILLAGRDEGCPPPHPEHQDRVLEDDHPHAVEVQDDVTPPREARDGGPAAEGEVAASASPEQAE